MSKYDKYLGHSVLENLLKSAITDSIKANSSFQYKSGMIPKIVRRSSGHCCKWCDEVAGTYEYPDVPKDVYRRHPRCTCSVEYDPGDGKRQNVHNKNWTDQENNDKIENRKNIRGISLYHPELKKSLDLDDFEGATYGRNIDEEVANAIFNTLKKIERADGRLYFSEVRIVILGPSELLQTERLANGLTRLNMSKEMLEGRTKKVLDKIIKSSNSTAAKNVEEATIHECGHAKLIYGMHNRDVEKLYRELEKDKKSGKGISRIAENDGVECIAEVEVLLSRGEKVPKVAMELYKKYMGDKS